MAEAGEDAKLTACGTPAWTAPEIVKMERYTEKVDVYSMGIVLWELITRQEPYGGQKGVQIAYAAAEQGLRPKIPNYCPPDYAQLMQECWAANPEERPAFEEILKRLFQLKKQADQAAAMALAAGGLAQGAPGFNATPPDTQATPSPPNTSRRTSATAAQQFPANPSPVPSPAPSRTRPSPSPLDVNAANNINAGGGPVALAPGASPHPVKHHLSMAIVTPKSANAGPVVVSAEEEGEEEERIAVTVTVRPPVEAAAPVDSGSADGREATSQSAIDFSKAVKKAPAAATAAASASKGKPESHNSKTGINSSSGAVTDAFTPLPDADEEDDDGNSNESATGSGAATNGDSAVAVTGGAAPAAAMPTSARGLGNGNGAAANKRSFSRREDVQRAINLGIVSVAAAKADWDGDVTT